MNITISLPPELNAFVRAKVDSGRYSSTSEVMREALRLMEREDQRRLQELAYVRQLVDEGIISGRAGPLDLGRIRAEGAKRLAAEALQVPDKGQ